MARMIRKRLLESLSNIDDWKVVEANRVERRDDGVWIVMVDHKHVAVGNTDHGVAQIVFGTDPEFLEAWFKVTNFEPLNKRHRSLLVDLGIDQVV